MRVTSEQQLAAFVAPHLPELERVRPNIWAVPFDMPGLLPRYAFGYLLVGGPGELHLIDAGLESDANWAALEAAVVEAGYTVSDISSVTLTHLHLDHTGLAVRLQREVGATVRMHEVEARAVHERAPLAGAEQLTAAMENWGVPEALRDELRGGMAAPASRGLDLVVDEELSDGDELRLGPFRLRVIHTPGHTAGHICLVDDEHGIVYTGDHVLPGINPGIGLGGTGFAGDPLGDYLHSLARVGELGDIEVCPGHAFRFLGAAERCAELTRHHLARGEAVQAVRNSHPGASLWEIASLLTWSQDWEEMSVATRFSALAQVELQVRRADGAPSA